MLLLDTDACIAIINGRPQVVRDRYADTLAGGLNVSVSSIVVAELWNSVGRSQYPSRNTDRLQTFLSVPIETLHFDDEDARIAGLERARLEAAGTPIGAYDLLIAAQALRHRHTLVTANVRDFSRVRGLIWQDWVAPQPH